MRSFTLFLLLCLVSGLAAQNTNDKLEAYFSFSQCKGTDESGNGSSGALIDNASCTCGVRDSAIYLDGDGDAVFFVGPLSDVFTTSDFTVSFYFKPDPYNPSAGGSQVIFSKQESCANKRAFWVRYNPKTRKISSGLSQNDTLFVNVTADLNPEACWQYITLVRNNTAYSIYVDGFLQETKTTVARIDLSSTAVFKAGEPVCTLDRSFKGAFDELRIYSKALKPDEIDLISLRPDKILNGDTVIYLGNSLPITTSSTCAVDYFWTPGTGVVDVMDANPTITPVATTTYKVEFYYSDGCVSSDTILVKVIDPDTLDCNKIFIPNAFTPGGSPGRNDWFAISNPYSVDEFISFEVFDRWGGRVFNAVTPLDRWDGSFQGEALNAGVFLYRLRYRCDGTEKVKAGSLTLLR
ncbi:MAG: gliding motility-associated C-terminal domain-containing protein [Saprospiraceae bacterium]|nr:gliding motility-associated C-terminal domain-containing protein [Saprospiraceae bacterium]